MKKILVSIFCLALVTHIFADVRVKPSETVGPVKFMNAVNNGPFKTRSDQSRGNFEEYKALAIPFARTHDASFCPEYGGPHTVDVNQIFPDFSKNPKDPSAYDFTHTDLYLQSIIDAGTQVFFRLGQAIEHNPKKYGVMPPADYEKWAEICEHIILHYNEGWADGHRWGIEYWEIWNEADLDTETWQTNPRCWGGTPEEFYKFYSIAAKHLKKRFPSLRIGGPALAGNQAWLDEFLEYMSVHKVPMDFVSWHVYSMYPESLSENASKIRKVMEKHGYGNAESILDEWNYVKGWSDEFIHSLDVVSNKKGAAFVASCMSACQNAPVDILMYYDFRIGSLFNGAFDIYTLKPRKPYYAFYAWKKLLQYGTQVQAESSEKDIYVTAAKGKNGRARVLVTRYDNDNNDTKLRDLRIKVDEIADGEMLAYLTDDCHSYTEIPLQVNDGAVNLYKPEST
jgi:hypothetical protein